MRLFFQVQDLYFKSSFKLGSLRTGGRTTNSSYLLVETLPLLHIPSDISTGHSSRLQANPKRSFKGPQGLLSPLDLLSGYT